MKEYVAVVYRLLMMWLLFVFLGVGVIFMFPELYPKLGLDHIIAPSHVVTLLATVYVGLVAMVAVLASINTRVDSKNITMKTISRVIVQNKILIVIDGSVFEKQTIEWADVNLHLVKRKIMRNFFFTALDEEIYISLDCTSELAVTNASTETITFELGEEDEQRAEQEKV